MNMQIDNNIYFGQLVPTKPLLKSLVKIHTYDEAKELYLSTSDKFVGNIGFYKRAIIIADNAVEKNENIRKIFQELSVLSKEEANLRINEIVQGLGKNINIDL